MGVLYLQDAVCVVPERPDLTQNLSYAVSAVEEMGGSCQLFASASLLPGGAEEIASAFRAQADVHLDEILVRLQTVAASLGTADTPLLFERAHEDLKRERGSYLHARKLAVFGASSERETAIDTCMEQIKNTLDTGVSSGVK